MTADPWGGHLRPPPPGWHVIPDPSNAILGCDRCGHAQSQHSREDGVGCLHSYWLNDEYLYACTCMEPGTSEADQ